jgi:hypothetical protein
MKKLLLFFMVAGMLAACQQEKPGQYFASSPEIDLVKKANADYVAGNWDVMKSAYADTAKVYDNVWDRSQQVTADDFLKSLKGRAEKYSEYKISDDAIYEMIVTDKGEKWVHNWFLWTGKHKNGKEVEIPIHISFLVVDNKIAFQVNMYNVLPAYLAENPPPLADAGTAK